MIWGWEVFLIILEVVLFPPTTSPFALAFKCNIQQHN